MKRISKKQIYRVWDNRRTALQKKHLWIGLTYYSIYDIVCGKWVNEKTFKSNRLLYDYILFGA